MSVPTTLVWRRVPRDIMRRPESLYIIKRLPKERQLQLSVIYNALYSEANDQGFVDLEDLDVFCDYCWIDNKADVLDVLERMKERRIITEVDTRMYFINDWNDTLPAGDKRPALPIKSRRERIEAAAAAAAEKATKSALGNPGNTDGSDDAATPAAAGEDDSPEGGNGSSSGGFSSVENDKKLKSVATAPCSDKNGKNVATHRERDQKRERREKDTHTQKKSPPVPTACAGQSPDSGGFGPGPGQEESIKETAENIETGNTDDTGEKGDIVGTYASSDTSTPDVTGEISGAVAEGKTERTPFEKLTDDDLQNGENWIPDDAPPPREWISPCEALRKCFLRENDMAFVDEKAESEALTILAARISALGCKKFNAEIVATQFVFAFSRLVKDVEYFHGMPITPRYLLKPAIFEKVFVKVQATLFPRGNTAGSWAKTYEKTAIEAQKDAEIHDPQESTRLIYSNAGIDPDDPDRYRKLYAWQKDRRKEKAG